jgi:DHA1 family multidrug resistance protein-like MFS transporter
VTAGFLSLGAGYALLAPRGGLALLAAAAALAAFGSGALRPSLTALVTQRAGRGEQGAVLGLTQALTSLAQLSAPLVGGVLLSCRSLAGWAMLAAAASWLGLLVRSDVGKDVASNASN